MSLKELVDQYGVVHALHTRLTVLGQQFEGEATPGNLASKTTYGVLKEPGVADLNSSLKVLTVCVPLPEGEY